MLYSTSIEKLNAVLLPQQIKIVAWSANNKGNGASNLHVAVVPVTTPRATMFRLQADVIRDAYTAHWHGQCEMSRIKNVLSLNVEVVK